MRPTEVFTNKARYYHEFRPRYSEEIITILTTEINLHPSPSFKIADIGSGTGFLSELFLKNGNTVFGVEPNNDMRAIAEEVLSGYPNFISVNGTAEATTIEAKVDAITAAQSFDWFDAVKARKEFQRILNPNGYIIIIFDQRGGEATSLGNDLNALLNRFGKEPSLRLPEQDEIQVLVDFFGTKGFRKRVINNVRKMSYKEFSGMLLSISSIPNANDPKYPEMTQALKKIFDKFQDNRVLTSKYETEIIFGQL